MSFSELFGDGNGATAIYDFQEVRDVIPRACLTMVTEPLPYPTLRKYVMSFFERVQW